MKAKTSQYHLYELNSVWRKALHLAKKEEVPANSTWREDDNNYFSFLDKGKIRLESVSTQGKLRISAHFQSGCIIREGGVFQQNLQIGAAFVTIEPCTIYHFPSKLLKDVEFIREYPDLIINLLESLTAKLTSTHENLSDSSNTLAKQSLCKFIEDLATKHDANTFALQLSQAELAATLGCHRSTLCKAIKELREENVLGAFRRNKLEIFDRSMLKKYVEEI